MSAERTVKQRIATVIKKFHFDELESSVMTAFPEISWADLKAGLVKHRKSFTSTNAAQIFEILITEANIRETVLINRLTTLQLIDTSWHSNKKIWYGYRYTNSNRSPIYLTTREILSDMEDYFASLNITIDVRINVHNDITYISLIEKRSNKKRRKEQFMRPIYVAIFMGQTYFFSTNRYLSSDILSAIARTMGFNNSKRFMLSGRDLPSLSQLCWNKRKGAMELEHVLKDLTYVENEPVIRDTGVNFTQQKARQDFAKRCFTNNPPKLEILVIKGPNVPFTHEYVSIELPDTQIRARWEFRSHNVAKFLSKLIERRIIDTPVPNYISNLLTLGTNELTLEAIND